jgi:hypothetical protein
MQALLLLLSSFDKLFAAIDAIFVSFASLFCMHFFGTFAGRDVFIHHLATPGAKADRSVWAAVIKVGAPVLPS